MVGERCMPSCHELPYGGHAAGSEAHAATLALAAASKVADDAAVGMRRDEGQQLIGELEVVAVLAEELMGGVEQLQQDRRPLCAHRLFAWGTSATIRGLRSGDAGCEGGARVAVGRARRRMGSSTVPATASGTVEAEALCRLVPKRDELLVEKLAEAARRPVVWIEQQLGEAAHLGCACERASLATVE